MFNSFEPASPFRGTGGGETFTTSREETTCRITLQAGDILSVSTGYGEKEVTLQRDGVTSDAFRYAAFARNKKSDTANEAKSDATVLTEIGYIKGGIDDIKAEQREQRKTNTEFVERLVAVEASAKQAHKRIDTLERAHEE